MTLNVKTPDMAYKKVKKPQAIINGLLTVIIITKKKG